MSMHSLDPNPHDPEAPTRRVDTVPQCRALEAVARFYDERKVGDVGALGFRRSTDLLTLLDCLPPLLARNLLIPGQSRFLDLGCADGRVNVFLSYLTRVSAGIELDDWTLDEYAPLRQTLDTRLASEGIPLPPRNIHLFHGDSTSQKVHRALKAETGFAFEEYDLFYTYLVMHEEFSQLIRERAKPGAIFMVYGLSRILPRYPGMRLITQPQPLQGILAVYQKE